MSSYKKTLRYAEGAITNSYSQDLTRIILDFTGKWLSEATLVGGV